jgi:hypothetical protein
MMIQEAINYVNERIAKIEQANPVGVLQPWERDACPDALKHWGFVQQRIALSRSNPQNTACCRDLNLTLPERTESQKRAAEANGRRLAEAKRAA